MARAVEKPDDQEIHDLILFFFFLSYCFLFLFSTFSPFLFFSFFFCCFPPPPLLPVLSLSPPPIVSHFHTHSFSYWNLSLYTSLFYSPFSYLLFRLSFIHCFLSSSLSFIHFFFFTTISFFLSILLYASTFLTPFLFNCLSFRLLQIFSVTYNLRAVLHLQHIQY